MLLFESLDFHYLIRHVHFKFFQTVSKYPQWHSAQPKILNGFPFYLVFFQAIGNLDNMQSPEIGQV